MKNQVFDELFCVFWIINGFFFITDGFLFCIRRKNYTSENNFCDLSLILKNYLLVEFLSIKIVVSFDFDDNLRYFSALSKGICRKTLSKYLNKNGNKKTI